MSPSGLLASGSSRTPRGRGDPGRTPWSSSGVLDLDVLIGGYPDVLRHRAADLVQLIDHARAKADDRNAARQRHEDVLVEQEGLDLFDQLLALRRVGGSAVLPPAIVDLAP